MAFLKVIPSRVKAIANNTNQKKKKPEVSRLILSDSMNQIIIELDANTSIANRPMTKTKVSL